MKTSVSSVEGTLILPALFCNSHYQKMTFVQGCTKMKHNKL